MWFLFQNYPVDFTLSLCALVSSRSTLRLWLYILLLASRPFLLIHMRLLDATWYHTTYTMPGSPFVFRPRSRFHVPPPSRSYVRIPCDAGTSQKWCKPHRTIGGASTPLPSSITGRAAQFPSKVARLQSGYRWSRRQWVHMEMLDQVPSMPALFQDAFDPSTHAFPAWLHPRQPTLRRFGRAELDRARPLEKNSVAETQEALRAPSAFWALGLERLHILDLESKAILRNKVAKPSVPKGHTVSINHATTTPPGAIS